MEDELKGDMLRKHRRRRDRASWLQKLGLRYKRSSAEFFRDESRSVKISLIVRDRFTIIRRNNMKSVFRWLSRIMFNFLNVWELVPHRTIAWKNIKGCLCLSIFSFIFGNNLALNLIIEWSKEPGICRNRNWWHFFR